MPRSSLLVLCLALAGCAAEPPAAPPRVPAAPLPTMSQQAAPFDAEIAALPARPAGAALAVASEVHALVRQRPALQPAVALPAARPATASSAAAVALSARVLAVQAAYRRWCAGDALPDDERLLAEAGGLHLPGAIACQPPALGQPRPLIPESRRFWDEGNRAQ